MLSLFTVLLPGYSEQQVQLVCMLYLLLTSGTHIWYELSWTYSSLAWRRLLQMVESSSKWSLKFLIFYRRLQMKVWWDEMLPWFVVTRCHAQPDRLRFAAGLGSCLAPRNKSRKIFIFHYGRWWFVSQIKNTDQKLVWHITVNRLKVSNVIQRECFCLLSTVVLIPASRAKNKGTNQKRGGHLWLRQD